MDQKHQLALALHNMLWVWHQYAPGKHFEHMNMAAGENAVEQLEDFGLVEDMGYHAELTDKGRALMDLESHETDAMVEILEL